MSSWDNKSNSEIILEIKQLQANHEALKAELLRKYDTLESIEKRFEEAHNELLTRLNGKKT